MPLTTKQRKALATLRKRFKTLCDAKLAPERTLLWENSDATTIAGWFNDAQLSTQCSPDIAEAILGFPVIDFFVIFSCFFVLTFLRPISTWERPLPSWVRFLGFSEVWRFVSVGHTSFDLSSGYVTLPFFLRFLGEDPLGIFVQFLFR